MEKKFAVMRIQKLKSVGSCINVLSHNRREKELYHLTHPERKNIVLLSQNTYAADVDYKDVLKERIKGPIRKNAVYGIEVIMTFSNGAIKEDKLKDWSKSSMTWIKENFGGEKNIISAILHRDELENHIHVLILPEVDSKLNCKKFIQGKSSLSKLQDSYAEAVKEFGLERGISREITQKSHDSHKTWINENAAKQERLDFLENENLAQKELIRQLQNKLYEKEGNIYDR